DRNRAVLLADERRHHSDLREGGGLSRRCSPHPFSLLRRMGTPVEFSRPMKRLCVLTGTVMAILAPACGSETTSPPPPPPSGNAVTVNTVGTTFQPANITVPAGTRVIWTDTDGISHTVTSGTGSAASNVGQMFDMSLADHASVQFTFQSAGVFP